MAEQVLYTSDVNIKTATIEVKVMKIGNRQVTLAVFRQLPRLPIIDYKTGELRGSPWGRVNYHVGCENKEPYAPYIPKNHLHIVWELHGRLFHSVVVDWDHSREGEIRGTWTSSYNYLENLDQLFIAV